MHLKLIQKFLTNQNITISFVISTSMWFCFYKQYLKVEEENRNHKSVVNDTQLSDV